MLEIPASYYSIYFLHLADMQTYSPARRVYCGPITHARSPFVYSANCGCCPYLRSFMQRLTFLFAAVFTKLLLMTAVGNILLTLLPQLFLNFQKEANENLTNAFPYSDLVHRPFSEERRIEMREEAKRMFYWGYDNYITHAFPFDELNPINCTGRGHDWEHLYV